MLWRPFVSLSFQAIELIASRHQYYPVLCSTQKLVNLVISADLFCVNLFSRYISRHRVRVPQFWQQGKKKIERRGRSYFPTLDFRRACRHAWETPSETFMQSDDVPAIKDLPAIWQTHLLELAKVMAAPAREHSLKITNKRQLVIFSEFL